MGYKKLNELNQYELKTVFNKNKQLQDTILYSMEQNKKYIINQYLNCMEVYLQRRLNENHDPYNRFIQDVKKLQLNYGFLPDTDNAFIQSIENELNQLDDLNYYSDEYDDLLAKIEKDIELLEIKITDQVTNQYNYKSTKESQLEYFLKFFIEAHKKGDYFIDNDTYILYEDTHYTKSYE